jgi:hypothetical protein
MKKIYEQPQTLTVIVQTSMPLQTSGGLPSAIQDPGISGSSGSRELRDFDDFEETRQSRRNWDDEENY